MFRVIFQIPFILILLVCSFFIICNSEAKVKAKLSRKYIPPGNPGGADFYADEDFVESYKLYEKRRKLLNRKKLQNINVTKESLAKKLREKKIVNDESSYQETCVIDDEENSMINQYGINLARLKGAVFIDQESVFQSEDRPQGGKKLQEKKISPINVTIKENPSKRMICSHDSINNLNINDK